MAVIAAILSAVEFFARRQGGLPKEKRCASQRISSQEEGFNMITTLTAFPFVCALMTWITLLIGK